MHGEQLLTQTYSPRSRFHSPSVCHDDPVSPFETARILKLTSKGLKLNQSMYEKISKDIEAAKEKNDAGKYMTKTIY